jgi:methyl-accepting chemotaxis protein
MKKQVKIFNIFEDSFKKISNFNINIKTDPKLINRQDELGKVFSSLQKMIKGINILMNLLQKNIHEITTASEQLSSISEQVSQNTDQQAASTEQISASMEQITSTIHQNNTKAEYSFNTIKASNIRIQNNKDAIEQTIKLIKEISQQIKIIEEISEKTDILSINAAIEAAKAGDAGKGFSVVAQEIRKLADISKKSAKKIKKLSQQGTEISQMSEQMLASLIPGIEQSTNEINNIINANKEQLKNTEEIKNSILQLAASVNENSSSAEELASAAQELSSEAQNLKQIIDKIKTTKKYENN